MKKIHNYHIYITTNPKQKVLYIGVTNNLARRLVEHYANRGNDKTWAGKYYAYNLIYFEQFQYINVAIAREKELKDWNREQKEILISTKNSKWKFLNKEFCQEWPPRKIWGTYMESYKQRVQEKEETFRSTNFLDNPNVYIYDQHQESISEGTTQQSLSSKFPINPQETMNEGYVKKNLLKKGLLEIEFFHPKHNSLPSTILAELAASITKAGQDETIQVIILKSGGNRTFCAGASFEELMALNDFPTGKKFFMGFANVINACRKCPKIIIGSVQGKAVGGGVGVASAVDYCLATKYAGIKLSELNVGIGPFVVGPAVERKIGVAAMSQLAINANEFQSAEWARDKGLYAEVFDNVEALEEGVIKLADYLLSTNPEAQTGLKKVFWEAYDHWDELLEQRAEMSGQLVLSEFTKAALASYALK